MQKMDISFSLSPLPSLLYYRDKKAGHCNALNYYTLVVALAELLLVESPAAFVARTR